MKLWERPGPRLFAFVCALAGALFVPGLALAQQTDADKIKALEAAEDSSQLALDANKLGYTVGVRINIDVLNSQSQLYQTKRDLAQARYNVMLGALKLRQANGTLRPEDLQSVNALLQ